jgi:hypothetical protein
MLRKDFHRITIGIQRLALAAVVIGAGLSAGAQSPVRTIEDGALDKIELFVASLEKPADLTVVIKPFDASGANLGTGGKDGKEARQQEAKTMQNEGPRVLADRLAATLTESKAFKQVQVAKADEAVPAGGVVIEGKFLTLDPGSRAKRYFAGFGAGKSSVEVAGSIKDANGRTLANFAQRRVGAMGMGGGDSLGKLMSDSKDIGEDIAKFLTKWAAGENLK